MSRLEYNSLQIRVVNSRNFKSEEKIENVKDVTEDAIEKAKPSIEHEVSIATTSLKSTSADTANSMSVSKDAK